MALAGEPDLTLTPRSPEAISPPSPAGGGLHFAPDPGFLIALRRRIDDYFHSTGLPRRGCPAMYRKTLITFAWLGLAYALLVFWASTWWQVLPLALALGLAMALVGFNVQHDGGHDAYSERPWVNKLMALSLDLLGGSSYLWRLRHHVIHHTYVNITGHDDDINMGLLARLTPHQRRLAFHRWQHWYLWPLYGLITAKWNFVDDFRDYLVGRVGDRRISRPRGWAFVAFWGGKAVFFSLALAVPLLRHSPWVVLAVYGLVSYLAGLVLSVVFQLAHCVEEAAFPAAGSPARVENSWAVHQVETTVDFAPRSRLAAWLLGGLNFQIEHHLFPRICHVNYPALAPLVEQTCREFGVRYTVNGTFWAGLASHYRWLRRMGQPCPA